MANIKVFKRTEHDCATASIATYLNIPYEAAPVFGNRGFNFDAWIWRHPLWQDKCEINSSNMDDWLDKHDLKISIKTNKRFAWPWEYSLGIIIGVDCSGRESGHMVVMKGRKIWHDPEIVPRDYDDSKDIAYRLYITRKED